MKTLLALVFALPLVAAPSLTIDQVLSAPFPDHLTVSPKGNAIAWTQDAAGVRNIWIVRAPEYHAVQITKFSKDDGQELTDLAWKPDGSAVVFTHGDGANPRSDPAGAHQEIWLAPLSGTPSKLAEGASPAVSPDSSTIVWILNGQVWTLKNGKPEQLIHARGTARDLRWSPDGSHFAFVSSRSDHVLIAVYGIHEKSLRFVDPSVDKDQSPVWSPDGTQIAYIRVPTNPTDFEYGPRRTGPPWSIRVADVRTAQGTEIWRAAEGRGSVFWPMSAANQLSWMTGGNLVFPWERDGWLHLYSVSSRGGEARLLTPGDFEVESAEADPNRNGFVFSSNQDDPDRRHLWRVSGGSPQRLTSGSGIEWTPAPLADGRVALLHSDAKAPARAALLASDGALRDLAPLNFPSALLQEPQPVILTAKDGLKLHAQLFLPPDDKTGRHPAVVFFHGGSRRQMLLGWHSMQYYNQAYGFNQYLASKGYVVLSVNYRGGIGYGTDFREAPGYGATGASEFNDIMAAGSFLRARADVDPARIGVWGGSYGGYLTALALARASDTFAAGVDLHGIHDWNLEVTSTAPARDREKRQAIERLAFESSPMASIKTWKSPVLLIQGDDDRTVAFGQTVQLVEALRKQGVPFEQLIFPDEVHDFLVHADWLAAYHAADNFLARYLKP